MIQFSKMTATRVIDGWALYDENGTYLYVITRTGSETFTIKRK
jgi:hypothetical protein